MIHTFWESLHSSTPLHSGGSKTLSQWVQIIKNKISGFNYININKIKYKNMKFYLQIWSILKNEGCKCTPSVGYRSARPFHILLCPSTLSFARTIPPQLLFIIFFCSKLFFGSLIRVNEAFDPNEMEAVM